MYIRKYVYKMHPWPLFVPLRFLLEIHKLINSFCISEENEWWFMGGQTDYGIVYVCIHSFYPGASPRDINTPDNHLNPENMMTITIIKRYIFKKWNNYKQVIHYHLYHVISFSQYIIV